MGHIHRHQNDKMFNRMLPVLQNAGKAAFRAPVAQRAAGIRCFSAGTFLDKNEVTDRVLNVVKAFDKVDADKVVVDAKFIQDLGLDSLDVVEVVMAMEEEFVIEIPDNEAESLLTPAQVVEFIASHPQAK